MTSPTDQMKDMARTVQSGAKDVAHNVKNEAKDVADNVQSGAKDMAHRVQSGAKDMANTVQSEAKEYMHDGQEWLSEADDTIRQAMREHPIACLFAALGIGYSVGRLIAKR